jgi:predicted phosphodiesterase
MPPKGTPGGDQITEIARRLVRENPDHAARGLARMLVAESNGALTIDQARNRIMRQLGVHGNADRKVVKAAASREPRQAGVNYTLPPSIARPWTRYRLEVTGRVGILSDVHVPYHSEIAVRAAVGHLVEIGIEALVLNGDLADFYSISRYMKDPRQRDFSGELEAVRDFVGWIRETFPKIPIVYKAGNHEERWQHYIWQHAPELSKERRMSLQAWLNLDDHGIDLVEDQRPIMAGRLPILHGHELPKGMSSPVNPARGAYMRMKHTGLVGHHHRTSGHAEADFDHRETFNWSTGCLCDLTPEYARINSWNWGFAVATIHADGEFDVENLRITADGKVRSS